MNTFTPFPDGSNTLDGFVNEFSRSFSFLNVSAFNLRALRKGSADGRLGYSDIAGGCGGLSADLFNVFSILFGLKWVHAPFVCFIFLPCKLLLKCIRRIKIIYIEKISKLRLE